MLDSRLLERIRAKKQALDALRPLPTAAVRRLQEQINTEWIYNSNAIEGSTLTLQETRLILETGMTIGGKSLREHFEVVNHQKAIDFVESLVRSETPVTPFHVRQIHQLVLTQIDDKGAGNYRQLTVRITGSTYMPPEPWDVPGRMADWEQWLHGEAQSLHVVARAAMAHHKLVAIHPFIDGNGRTARSVMNLLLMREGYPPSVIAKAYRRQYYRVLAQADRGREKPLVNFVGRAVEQSLTRYLEACTPRSEPPAEEQRWILLREATEFSNYSQAYLSLLARTGRLEAMKRGRNWYTTREAVATYEQSVTG